jgi:type I restriction enzyme S subunit
VTKPPKGWKIERLDKLAEVQTGIAKGAQKERPVVSLPYLRVANVQDGHVDLTEIKVVDVPKRKVNRFLLRRGDLLMTEGGDFDKLGRGCIWEGQIDPCVHQNHVFAVRVTSPELQNEFLQQLTASPWGRRYFLSCSKQSTNLASVNTSQLKAFPVLLPPIPEQKRIAAILGAWDKAIEMVQTLVAKKSSRLIALRRQLLTGARGFPKLGRGKWRRHQLSEILKHIFRAVNWSPKAMFHLISIRRRCGGLFRREDLLGADYKTTDLHEIRTGDFLVSKRQVVHGAWAMVTKEFSGCHVSKEYSILVNKAPDVLHMPFFDWLSHEQRMWHLAFLASDGVHREKLIFDSKDFLRHYIELPPTIKEQQRIVEVLDACDRELRLLEAELEALKLQKRGLMQKLLTGKIRVKT